MWIINNASNCGSLDDIVIYIKKDSQEHVYLIQCKHSNEQKKITLSDFCTKSKCKGKKQPFLLKNYYESYKSIVSSTEDNKINRTIKRLNQHVTCVIYTNYDIEHNCMEILQLSNERLPYFNTTESSMVYGVIPNAERLRDVMEPTFSKNLLIYSNQAHCNKIKFYIGETIRREFNISIISGYIHKIIDDFILFIMKWADNQLGPRFFLTKKLIMNKITELILERYFTLIRFPNNNTAKDLYTNNSIYNKVYEKWKLIIKDVGITTIIVENEEVYTEILNFLYYYYHREIEHYFKDIKISRKVVQWEKLLTKQNREKLLNGLEKRNENLKKELTRLTGCDGNISLQLLYKLLWKTGHVPLLLEMRSDVAGYQDILSLIKRSNYSIKVIVLLNKMKVKKNKNIYKQFFHLQDLNERALKVILNEHVRLQGRLIKLKKLTELYESLGKRITAADTLRILIHDGNFAIGEPLEKPPRYFIERTVSGLAIDVINSSELISYFKNPINIISATSGMGKTTILNNMSYKAPTNKWILKVDLKEYHEHSKNLKDISEPDKYMEYFYNNFSRCKVNTHLEQTIFQLYLKSKSVVILFDGFDSVATSALFKNEIVNICRSLKKGGFKIWLTTRSSWKQYLKEELDAKSLVLNPISKGEINELLSRYFIKQISNDRKCSVRLTRKFCHDLLLLLTRRIKKINENFIMVPQHLELLAEHFEDEYRAYVKKKMEMYELWEKFNLLDLLNTLVEKKKSIFLRSAESMYIHLYNCVEENIIQPYALRILEINNKNVQGFQIKTLQDDGIIEVTDQGNIQFVHRLFAEYFAAKWLSRNRQETDSIKRLFEQRYFVARNLFDGILAKNFPLHTAILNSQYFTAEELIKNGASSLFEENDEGGRTAFHIAAAWGVQHSLPKDLEEFTDTYSLYIQDGQDKLQGIMNKLIERFDGSMLPEDTILKFTPLDYALASNCLQNSNSILGRFQKCLNRSFIENAVPFYMYYCSRFNYSSLSEEISLHFRPEACETHEIIKILKPILVTKQEKLFLHYISEWNCILYLYLPISNTDFLSICCRQNNCKSVEFLQLLSFNKNTNSSYLYGTIPIKDKIKWNYKNQSITLNSCDVLDSYCKDTSDGKTILHHAAENNCKEAVSFFLDQGIDVNVKDNNGSTAVDLAIINNHDDIVMLFWLKEIDVALLFDNDVK